MSSRFGFDKVRSSRSGIHKGRGTGEREDYLLFDFSIFIGKTNPKKGHRQLRTIGSHSAFNSVPLLLTGEPPSDPLLRFCLLEGSTMTFFSIIRESPAAFYRAVGLPYPHLYPEGRKSLSANPGWLSRTGGPTHAPTASA